MSRLGSRPATKPEDQPDKEVLIHYHNPDRFSDESVQNRHRHFVRTKSLSQYAVTLSNQPNDVSTIQFHDDHYHFFAKGRDFQPQWKYHKYTPEEVKILETYEASSKLPSNSQIYREWTSQRQYTSLERVGWGIVMLIALMIGTLAFVIKELCEQLQIFYNPFIQDYIERGQPDRLLMYHAGISCAFVALSAIVCVYACPFAAGSGIPEIICILNGTVVRSALAFRTLICKTIAISFAVLSGLPIGFEGPLIHIGAMLAAQLSRPAKCKVPCKVRRIYDTGQDFAVSDENDAPASVHRCCRYRDSEERHSLICLGAACGIASAFSAPISAILFVMEEISTHWSVLLTWKAFVCCIIARSVTEVLSSLWAGLEHFKSPSFAFFEFSEAAVFDVQEILTLNLLIVIPAIALGIIGGLLGSFYIFLHLKVAKVRRKLLGKIKNQDALNIVKVLEPVLLALLSTVVIMGTLPYFTCRSLNYEVKKINKVEGKLLVFHAFRCGKPLVRTYQQNKIIQTGEYHEAATLLFCSWEQMIRNLFSRRTPKIFSISILLVILFFFFIFSSLTALTSIASGLLVPQLAIGALYGRILGIIAYDIAGNYVDLHSLDPDVKNEWEWLDPGAFALLGAASFMAGTTRLPITSVVMMIEMTNDINMCLLIMIVVMLSKAIGDYFTHPLYHSLIEFKCIPFLEYRLDIQFKKKKLNLDLFKVSQIMASPVRTVRCQESVQVIANILLETNHGGFPVVSAEMGFEKTFVGVITRMELTVLLTRTATFNAQELQRECRERIRISYPDYSSTKIKDVIATNMILNKFASEYPYHNVRVNLLPYVNTSAFAISAEMSLLRGYSLFRSLGLRHLVVTDNHNQVVGIITRKDLMAFMVVKKLKLVVCTSPEEANSVRNIQNDRRAGINNQVAGTSQ